MQTSDLSGLFFSHLAQTSPAPAGLVIKSAKGLDIQCTDGRKYTDLISGICVSNLGHGHPEVIQAVKEQSEKYLHVMVYGEYILQPQVELVTLLASLLPSSLQCSFLVNSGSEAVEGAIKLAKKYTGRREVISFWNAYHGSTMGSLSTMGNKRFKGPFRPLMPDVKHIRINQPDDLEFISGKTAAVILEPVQGEAGVIIAEPSFLKALREKCSSTGALLIFDEIQSGMGRTGKLFCFEHYQVLPDILLTAKAFGGGMPLGAFISSGEIMHCLSDKPALCHITTFGGNPVCCAAGLAALRVLSRGNIMEEVPEKSALFRDLLESHPAVREVRNCGLMMAVDLGSEIKVQNVIRQCLAGGLILDWFLFNPSSFRIAPPLIITKDQIRKCCRIILNALDK